MEKINVESFLIEYKKIEEKLRLIADIPKRWSGGEYFEGIEVEGEEIIYKTSTSYSGCGTDRYSFSIRIDELNNPIEYFKEKYQKEIDEDNKILKALELKAEIDKTNKEIQRLKELMEKYKEEIQ